MVGDAAAMEVVERPLMRATRSISTGTTLYTLGTIRGIVIARYTFFDANPITTEDGNGHRTSASIRSTVARMLRVWICLAVCAPCVWRWWYRDRR